MMKGDLLIVVPSRNRPQSIARFLDAVHGTAKMQTHVHVIIDNDDPEIERYKYVMDQAGKDGDVLTVGERKGLAGSTNDIAVPEAENYPYISSLGDDMIPRTPGWDRALIKAIERMGGTGISYPWDGVREDIPEAVLMSTDIIRTLGWMAYPGCSHWYIDNVWSDLGWGAGCIRHLRAISVEHAWKTDTTSKDSSEKLTCDRDAYYLWKKTRMAEDIKTIITLREKQLQSA